MTYPKNRSEMEIAIREYSYSQLSLTVQEAAIAFQIKYPDITQELKLFLAELPHTRKTLSRTHLSNVIAWLIETGSIV